MSYDLTFVRRLPGQSWEDVVETADGPADEGMPDPRMWERIVAGATQLLGGVTVFVGDDCYELDHEATGIQLTCYADEAGITLPYWHTGPDAHAAVEKVYQLGRLVEDATGLEGYDPQLDLPLAHAVAHLDLAVEAFNGVSAMFARRGLASPAQRT